MKAWLSQALSGHASQPSVSRLAYLLFVVLSALWLTVALLLGREWWVQAFTVYAGACTSGYVGGKIAGKPTVIANRRHGPDGDEAPTP